jgi:hypothetical protein
LDRFSAALDDSDDAHDVVFWWNYGVSAGEQERHSKAMVTSIWAAAKPPSPPPPPPPLFILFNWES